MLSCNMLNKVNYYFELSNLDWGYELLEEIKFCQIIAYSVL